MSVREKNKMIPLSQAVVFWGAPRKVLSVFSEASDAAARPAPVVLFVPTQQMFFWLSRFSCRVLFSFLNRRLLELFSFLFPQFR